MVYFGGFFAKLGHFAGFSLRMYPLIAGRINAAAMAWDIIFFSLAGPVGDYTGAQTVIFFYLLFAGRSAKLRCAGRRSGGHYFS